MIPIDLALEAAILVIPLPRGRRRRARTNKTVAVQLGRAAATVGKWRARFIEIEADPPRLHGRYTQWTRTAQGKTVTKLLAEAQLARYQPWFDSARTLRDLVAKLEIVSLQAVESEARLPSKTAPRSSTPARKPRRTQT